MGVCKTCGGNAGLMSSECPNCATKRHDAEVTRQAVQAKAAIAAQEVRRRDYVAQRFQTLEATVAAGRAAYVIKSVYIPVDSITLEKTWAEDFYLDAAREDSLLGWEVIGVVPRTVGIGLENRQQGMVLHTDSWAGGMGGNVIGVYLLLRYAVTDVTLETSRSTLETHFESLAKRLVN